MQKNRLFLFGDYDRTVIDGKPFINGRPNFRPEPFGGLLPGMKVHIIGTRNENDKVTSTHRLDTWTPFVEYAGTIPIEQYSNDATTRCLGFKVPPEGLIDKASGNAAEGDYYAIYGIIEDRELIRPNFNRFTIEIFKLVFVLEDGQTIKL